MIDFYRKSFLSEAGKQAGILTITEYTTQMEGKYTSYLSRVKDQKSKPRNEDYGLYL